MVHLININVIIYFTTKLSASQVQLSYSFNKHNILQN